MRPADNPVIFAAVGLGIDPHAGQVPYLLSTAQTKVLVGGRRSGKSYAISLETCFHAVRATVAGAPYRQLLVAPAVDQARELFTRVSETLRRSPFGGLIEHEVGSPFPDLRLAGGSRVFVRAAHEGGRHLRGHYADRVVVDEAAYVPGPVIQEAILPLLADKGGTLVLASTPAGKGGVFHRYWQRGQGGDPRVASFLFKTVENPHVDAGYVAAQRGELSARQYAVEYEGSFLDAEDGAFAWDHVIGCATGAAESPRAGRRYVVGWDPAKRRDGSAVVVLDTSEHPRRVVHMEDLRGLDYTAQVARVAAVARSYGARAVVDATGLGDAVIDLLRAAGTVVEAVRFTSATKAALVQALAVALERRGLVYPAERRLLDELRDLRSHVSEGGQVRYSAEAGACDDFVFALALALRGADGASQRCPAETGALPFYTSAFEESSPRFPRDPIARWFAEADALDDA